MRVIQIVALIAMILSACTTRQVLNVALNKDPQRTLETMATRKLSTYERDPLRLIADAKGVKRNFDKLIGTLRQVIGEKWGVKEVKLPTSKVYVKYTHNYKSRAIVDFDSGIVTVETLDQAKPKPSLKNAILTTLLTPDDPRSVDLFSDKMVELKGTPYLHGLVLDHHSQPIADPSKAEAYAQHLITLQLHTRYISFGRGRKKVAYVKFDMVNDHVNKRAQRYAPIVARYSQKYNISRSLIHAIIKVESNFNPFAVSSAPAYGLMQLVPMSGGRDAYRRVRGVDRIPTKEYLFNAKNNIELGTAYLSIITYELFDQIADPVSREYCIIAAYNTGRANVLKTFSRDQRRAIHKINSLHPGDVYKKLRTRLPYGETRTYLRNVVNARREFVEL